MPRFQDEQLQFDVPRDWVDRTIVAFAEPARPTAAPTSNVVMTRETLADGVTRAAYVDQHLADLEQRAEQLELLGRESRQVGGRPATILQLRSGSGPARVEQRLVMVQLPGRMVATITMTMPEPDVAQMAPLFDRILTTVRIESGGDR